MEEEYFNPVTRDIPNKEKDHRASIEHLLIESEGERMLGVLFRAQGEGPHPTAIILHGFPGHDRNLDIAHTLRRGGFNSVVFHYRGSWGSEGVLSFSGMIEDVKAAIYHLKRNDHDLSVDSSNLFMIGHSMGAWAGMMASLEVEDIRAIANLAGFNLGAIADFISENDLNAQLVRSTLERLSTPMRTSSTDILLGEILEKGRDWDLTTHSVELAGRSLLLTWAKNDQLSIPEIHFHPLYESLFSAGADHMITHMVDSDHSFSDSRIELQRTVWNWISKIRETSGGPCVRRED
jgi:hypothetical protein